MGVCRDEGSTCVRNRSLYLFPGGGRPVWRKRDAILERREGKVGQVIKRRCSPDFGVPLADLSFGKPTLVVMSPGLSGHLWPS
ncbi:hypothetical protein GN956_G5360 [Arapaima gigas]